MRTTLLVIFVYFVLLGCSKNGGEADFYKDLNTGEILSRSQFEKFQETIPQQYLDSSKKDGIHRPYIDTLKTNVFTKFHFYEMLSSNDSLIRPFKYDLRVNDEYVVRAHSYEKVGTEIPQQQFITIDGDRVQIGGSQPKPTLINLWFVGCGGCVEEMPSLNRLQEKYSHKVNFIAMTFDEESKVKKFLEKKSFNFKHITGAHDFINIIGTHPYPENIFINKEGYIVNIEGGLGDFEIEYFESMIEKLLQ